MDVSHLFVSVHLAVLVLIKPIGFCSNALNVLFFFAYLKKHLAKKYFRGFVSSGIGCCHWVSSS